MFSRTTPQIFLIFCSKQRLWSRKIITFSLFGGNLGGWVKKCPKKFFRVKNFFPLILPKKHSLITQKRFWAFFGVFSGFLGVPQNYIIWLFKSVFWQFLCEKNGRKSRDPASRLVYLIIFVKLISLNFLFRRLICKNLEFSPRPSIHSFGNI